MVDTIAAPAVREVESSTDYGKFEIEPLEPGFGTTLGNSLRRVLLSSLNGAAITSVSIDGVAHEFSAIPNIKEDVTEILLNIKEINVVSHSDEPVRITLDVRGPKEVTAGDIQTSSDVEIRNPDVHICTLDGPKSHLRMDLTVERGKGYVTAERNKREGQPIGVIPIDAIFTPVRRANFTIEKTRVGQETEWDKLVVEVWTDSTLSPVDAVSQAAALFTQHLDLFVRFGDNLAVPPQSQKRGNDLPSRLADTPIEDLELSVRALNCLKANDVTKVGQLVAMRQEDLLTLRNFGQKSLDEIREKLVERQMVTPEELETLFQPGGR
ncbi:MAG: DNA-directed RNA polymerase subunit alpha [Candidatus Dormibacteraeota bacterium]|jgi:DNA-directed RNA polymerase subunit alpha|uniref:DNA-directed RNA polymerase subunit alpha n=1 Tax=Candidatus Aeolococcus gillhamiae TaxID=3127015 RepID=A0A2W5Z6T8_9BACT|nr:DNA-directed RNA polymerase subunit alpha [Candidatus Dormibacteraeota bacterium]PZR81099.1 MAG: DNA-directed RNA polymerase subunit alpha [Candidatus Dormibacter sp. RRmetagenome_bin12]